MKYFQKQPIISTFQDGFGWTNGVVLDLLVTYQNRLKLPESMKI
ncbi:unnamed protein product [Dracunculus medinensis]|uniref:Alpha,alpha-trehalase n=1 Tax=Dracunculus medinensis TaxID=318479 RepID=A0A0N4UNV6_DRAME|nr:unnamed protein product [Dracunculus medinensis]